MAAGRTDFDIAIVGGGSAGCAAALALSRYTKRRVVLIERSAYSGTRVGESVSGAIAPLLAYLGIEQLLSERQHLPAFANIAAWGAPNLVSREFLFSAGGHGWLLDRAAFDADLAAAVERAGIRVLRNTEIARSTRASGVWEIQLKGRHSPNIAARQIIDATGRRCAIARASGARRQSFDDLVGLVTWLAFARQREQTRAVLVETVENGWWYSAPIPGHRLVLAYMTDAAELDRGLIGNANALLRFASGAPLTFARVSDGKPVSPPRVWLAMSAMTAPCVGEGWIAAGDAAASFDPLSSLGIGYAMTSGIQAARALDRRLNGDEEFAAGYAPDVSRHMAAYLDQRRRLYRYEQRWPDRPFWSRQHDLRLGARAAA